MIIKAVDDDDGMDRVEYNINGQDYVLKFGDTVIEYKQELLVGENPISYIRAYNKNGDVKEILNSTCPYYP